MAYIALRALNTKSGLIRAGKKVPDNYPRLKTAIRRGWVKSDGITPDPEPLPEPVDPVVLPESTPESETVTEEPSQPDDAPTKEATADDDAEKTDEETIPEITMESGVRELVFLTEHVVAGLVEIGVILVCDLADKSVEDLRAVTGIGTATAERLLESYQAIAGD